MTHQAKKMLIAAAALLLAAPAVQAGKGGRVKATKGSSGSCLSLSSSAELLDGPEGSSVRLRLSVADGCAGERRHAGGGEATFEVRADGRAACGPDRIAYEDLGTVEYECDIPLPEPGASVQLEACISAEAEDLDGKKVRGTLSASECSSLDLAIPAD